MRSMNDKGKVEGLKRVCRSLGMPFDDNDIFLFNGDVMECEDRFVERCDEYDAVICANDVSGLQLLRSPKLLARKRIPEDLYVISYGNTLLSRLCQPSLTTISLDYRQVGSIAVDNALYLRKNPDISCQHTTVRSKITLGASTNYEEVSLRGADMTPRFEVDTSVPSADDYIAFYKDATASRVLLVEGLLNELDKLSLYILLMLLRGYHKSRLMDALYISESTYKYRLRKICAAAGVKTRGELMELVGEWIDPAKLDEHLASLSMVNEDN